MTLSRAMLHALTRPFILFYTIPWLLVIVVLGTLAQRYMGLYEAEKMFFSSFIIWLGPVPLPGMYSVLALISLSLIAKLILKSPWNKKTAGTVITHMGALLLLLGAFLTTLTNEEGFITIAEGDSASIVSDYHERELAIYKDDTLIMTLPQADILADEIISTEHLPFTLKVLATFRHCDLVARESGGDALRGLAETIELTPAPLQKDNEANRWGLSLQVSGLAEEVDGTYIAFETALEPMAMTVEDITYRVVLQKTQRTLPFSVQLESFEKHAYPGSDVAEEYESVVTIMDGDIEWTAPIRMNEPLRYKGYTLYQSSFILVSDVEFSVLAVVKNTGRVFPYISSIVMCIGLLVHLMVRGYDRRKQAE